MKKQSKSIYEVAMPLVFWAAGSLKAEIKKNWTKEN